jgi:hypothetical protein
VEIFLWRFCAFLNKGEFKNTTKLFEESPCQKLLAEKVDSGVEKSFFPVGSLRLFLIAFLAVSLHEEPKNTIKIFSKIKPKNLQKFQEKVGR